MSKWRNLGLIGDMALFQRIAYSCSKFLSRFNRSYSAHSFCSRNVLLDDVGIFECYI
jgi:hypothetical protein